MTRFTMEDKISPAKEVEFGENMKEIVRDKSPCDGCQHFNLCKEHQLACRSFAKFVVDNYYYTEAVKDPCKGTFNKVFNQKDEDALRKYVRQWKKENGHQAEDNEEE